MPNWAEGNIRFRGKRENLIRFFSTELVTPYKRPDGTYGEKAVKLEPEAYGCMMRIVQGTDENESLYFRGSNRQYVDIDEFDNDSGFGHGMIEFSEGRNMNKDQIVIFAGYRAAWNVDQNYFKTKAEEYKIDIRTFVWEEGLEWSSITTWYRNGRIEEEVRTYSDWLWDSSMPYLGG